MNKLLPCVDQLIFENTIWATLNKYEYSQHIIKDFFKFLFSNKHQNKFWLDMIQKKLVQIQQKIAVHPKHNYVDLFDSQFDYITKKGITDKQKEEFIEKIKSVDMEQFEKLFEKNSFLEINILRPLIILFSLEIPLQEYIISKIKETDLFSKFHRDIIS